MCAGFKSRALNAAGDFCNLRSVAKITPDGASAAPCICSEICVFYISHADMLRPTVRQGDANAELLCYLLMCFVGFLCLSKAYPYTSTSSLLCQSIYGWFLLCILHLLSHWGVFHLLF